MKGCSAAVKRALICPKTDWLLGTDGRILLKWILNRLGGHGLD
jgi:hypothetical protein